MKNLFLKHVFKIVMVFAFCFSFTSYVFATPAIVGSVMYINNGIIDNQHNLTFTIEATDVSSPSLLYFKYNDDASSGCDNNTNLNHLILGSQNSQGGMYDFTPVQVPDTSGSFCYKILYQGQVLAGPTTFDDLVSDSPETLDYTVKANPMPSDPGPETGTLSVDLLTEPISSSPDVVISFSRNGNTATCTTGEIFSSVLSVSITTTISAIACDSDDNPVSAEAIFTYDFGTTVTTTTTGTLITLDNPIGPDTLQEFIKKILDIVLTIGIPIVALAIIYAGYLFVSARGNSEKLGEAKDTLMYTILGAAILLGSWVLASAISTTITSFQ